MIISDHYIVAVFIDIPEVAPNLDIIQLAAYDFQTPERNPSEGDFPAPIYELNERNPENNVNYQVQYWTTNQFAVAPSKLCVCIPTFGRTWQLQEDSTQTGVPPILEVSLFFIFNSFLSDTDILDTNALFLV